MKTLALSATALVALCFAAVAVVDLRPAPAAGEESPQLVRAGEMSVARAAHQATRLPAGGVLITGGCGGVGCGPVYDSAEIYEPSTATFRGAAPMSLARASHAAVALPDGRVLVSGGWTGSSATASAEIYDPAADEWSRVGEMSAPRVSHTAVLLRNGRVLVVGGGAGRLGSLVTAEVFDPETSSFTTVGRMRSNHYLATALADGRVLLTGGQDERGEIVASAEIFDPATDTFEPTGSMAVPRVKHGAALLPNGTVLVIGGSDERGYSARFVSTEIYDPARGEFTRGPDLRHGRHKIRDAVAVLPSGAVLVAGGAAQPELFDPAGRVFIPVEGRLSGAQMFATATVLEDGRVLVSGGYDEEIRSSPAAWLADADR